MPEPLVDSCKTDLSSKGFDCVNRPLLVGLSIAVSYLRLMSLWKNNALPSFEEFFAAATAPDICFGEGQTDTTKCSWDAMSSLNVAT